MSDYKKMFIGIDLRGTGSNIKRLRLQNGISISDLCEIIGVSDQAFYSWQRGDKLPCLDHLVILARVLDSTLDEIVSIREPQEPER